MVIVLPRGSSPTPPFYVVRRQNTGSIQSINIPYIYTRQRKEPMVNTVRRPERSGVFGGLDPKKRAIRRLEQEISTCMSASLDGYGTILLILFV
jgi:hypothetical protein